MFGMFTQTECSCNLQLPSYTQLKLITHPYSSQALKSIKTSNIDVETNTTGSYNGNAKLYQKGRGCCNEGLIVLSNASDKLW